MVVKDDRPMVNPREDGHAAGSVDLSLPRTPFLSVLGSGAWGLGIVGFVRRRKLNMKRMPQGDGLRLTAYGLSDGA